MASATAPLIWIGLGGLLVTGAFLRPDLSSPLTWVKLCAVLFVGLNGLRAGVLGRQIMQLLATAPLDVSLHRRIVLSSIASQLCWCTAIVIGLVTSSARVL